METKTFNAVCLYKGELRNVISATVTRNASGNCTAEITIRPLKIGTPWIHAEARATGAGYNRESHSIANTFNKAGVPWSDIDTGISSENLINAMAKRFGVRGKLIIV